MDVREPNEFEIVSIPGATLIPKDRILSGDVHLVINTTVGIQSILDSKSLREAALRHRTPYVTTLAAARAMVDAIAAMREHDFGLPPPLQELHRH